MSGGITYMVTSYWRGALHVKNMRVFDDELLALAYAEQLVNDGEFVGCVYTLSENDKPNSFAQFKKDYVYEVGIRKSIVKRVK